MRAFKRLIRPQISKFENGDIVGSVAALWSMTAIDQFLERSYPKVAIDEDQIIRPDFQGEPER